MKKNILIVTCSTLVIGLGIGTGAYVKLNAVETQPIKMNFSESKVSQDELIKSADVIAKYKVEAIKERKNKTAKTVGEDGKEFSVTAPTIIYKLKPIENLKGTKTDETDLVMIDNGNDFIKIGEEYVMFLKNNKSEGTYTLTSYNQGLNMVKQKSSDELETAITKETTNYTDLKQKIKELSNSNQK